MLKLRLTLGGDFSIAHDSPPRTEGKKREWTPIKRPHPTKGFIVDWQPPRELEFGQHWREDIEAEIKLLEAQLATLGFDTNPWVPIESESGFVSDKDAKVFRLEELRAELDYAPPKPPVRRKPRGQGGITPQGRKNVRSGVVALEREWGKRNLSFFTGTVGGDLSKDEYVILTYKWSEVIRRFNQKLRRLACNKCRIKALPYVGVTEIGEKRWRKYGDVTFHYHCVFPGRKSYRDPWRYSISEVEGCWFASVSEVIGRAWKSPSACNLQGIKKSAAAYLGKYMSKGSQVLKEVQSSGCPCQFPTAWYSWADEVRVYVGKHERILSLPDVSISKVVDLIPSLPGTFYAHPFALEDGRITAVFGRILPSGRNEFVRYLFTVLSEQMPCHDCSQ